MYVITGATGNTGRRIAEALLFQGKKVRVIGRDGARLQPLADKRAEPFVGSLDDGAAMARAFTGATAVYAMIPPNLSAKNLRAYQNAVGEALAKAITAARVSYVVHLSSVGAHLPEKAGPITGLHDQEQRLNGLKGVQVVHLRPGFFMENFYWSIDLIKKMGINGGPLRADLPIGMIATQDIAAAAAQRLAELDFSGTSVRELLGQRDVTMAEATQALGRAIGKPELKYVQFPYDEAEKAMVGMGLSASVASGFIEMYRAFNEGTIRPTEARSNKNTTPTSIEEFATQFAVAYKG
ncbi:MAG: NmrA family NAD(P)-binding protein [Nitrospirota bacterium]